MGNLRSHPEINSYLARACRRIWSPKKRRIVREELLSHFEFSVEAKTGAGESVDRAIQLALQEMGPSDVLAKSLGAAHRPRLLELHILATLATCAVVVALLLAADGARRILDRLDSVEREVVARHRDRFLADQKVLRVLPAFVLPGLKADAGLALNAFVGWERSQDSLPAAVLRGADGFQLPEELKRKLARPKAYEDWHLLGAEVAQARINAGWMKDLSRFDHWDLYRAGPVAEFLKSHPELGPWSLPVPDFEGIRAWSRLRYLQGLESGHVLSALREVRALGRLVYSTELLVSGMSYVGMLNEERDIFEIALKRGLLTRADWVPVGPVETQRAKRTIFGFGQMFSIWNEPETLQQIFDGKTAPVGMCGALTEGMSLSAFGRLLLSRSSLIEEDYGERLSRLDQILKGTRGSCHLSPVILKNWENPQYAKRWLNGGSWKDPWTYVYALGDWPVFRRLAFAHIADIIRPDFLSGNYRTNRLPAEN